MRAWSAQTDSAPLQEAWQLLGEPEFEVDISCDQPQAMLAVRLCDVAPDGSSLRLSYGLLNLSHRDGSEQPAALVPGRVVRVRLRLCALAQVVVPGHRLRLALSNSYWPIAWPSPVASCLTVHTAQARLRLPMYRPDAAMEAALPAFAQPEGAVPYALDEIRPRTTSAAQDRIEEPPGAGRIDLVRSRDRGAWKTRDTDVLYDVQGEMRFSIAPGDPLSASQSITMTTELGRPGWELRTAVTTRLTADADDFRILASLQAWEGAEVVFSREWDLRIPRDHQ